MTKLELMELIRSDMLDAVKQRDNINETLYAEEYGYFNGRYRAFENVIKLLMMFEIQELSPDDSRRTRS